MILEQSQKSTNFGKCQTFCTLMCFNDWHTEPLLAPPKMAQLQRYNCWHIFLPWQPPRFSCYYSRDSLSPPHWIFVYVWAELPWEEEAAEIGASSIFMDLRGPLNANQSSKPNWLWPLTVACYHCISCHQDGYWKLLFKIYFWYKVKKLKHITLLLGGNGFYFPFIKTKFSRIRIKEVWTYDRVKCSP